MGLYQDSQTSYSVATRDGDAIDSIHRRYSSTGQIQGAIGQSGSWDVLPAREPWVSSKPEEVHSGAVPDYGISRVHSGHCGDGDKASIRQAKENQGRVPEVGKGGSGFSQIISTVNWEMNTTSWVIPPAPLLYQRLQMKLSIALNKGPQDYET